jgi:hypothetical protein
MLSVPVIPDLLTYIASILPAWQLPAQNELFVVEMATIRPFVSSRTRMPESGAVFVLAADASP